MLEWRACRYSLRPVLVFFFMHKVGRRCQKRQNRICAPFLLHALCVFKKKKKKRKKEMKTTMQGHAPSVAVISVGDELGSLSDSSWAVCV